MPATATSDCLSIDDLHRLTERRGKADQLLAWAAHLAYCPHCARETASLNLEPAVLEVVDTLDGRSSQLFAALRDRLKPLSGNDSNVFATPAPARKSKPFSKSTPSVDPTPSSSCVSLDRLFAPVPPVGAGRDMPSHPPVRPHSVPFNSTRLITDDPLSQPVFRTGTQSAAVSDELLGLLTPRQGPDELGRLGTFRVLEVLRTGPDGVVLKAEDTHLQRLVSLRLPPPADVKTAAIRDRFLREGHALAKLQHPNVISVYQVGEVQGVPYLAMPVLQGETLGSRLQRETRMNLVDTLRIGREIALGLAAAHHRSIVHRHLSPETIWLEEGTGCVKIADFGAAASTPGDLARREIHSALFLSPEQAQGGPADYRSDLYSLGCILYKMCAGVPPITALDSRSLMAALATEQPRPLQTLNPDVPPPLLALINRLLTKHPDARAVKADDVATTIQAIEQILPRVLLPGTARLHWNERQAKQNGALVSVLLWSIILVSISMIAFLMLAPASWQRTIGNFFNTVLPK